MKVREFLSRADVRSLLVRIAGEEGLEVLDNLPLNKSINEFKLAEKLSKNINQVRSVLYKFYTYRIVLFDKKRDKKKGWFIYFWKLQPSNVVYLLKKEKEKELLSYRERLEEGKETQFFGCKKCKQEFEYMIALENNFMCPACGTVLKLVDKSRTIRAAEKEIEEIKKDIKNIDKNKK